MSHYIFFLLKWVNNNQENVIGLTRTFEPTANIKSSTLCLYFYKENNGSIKLPRASKEKFQQEYQNVL